MSAESQVMWPSMNVMSSSITSPTEGTNAQKQCNAAGEQFGILVNFDGVTSIESISIALGAGTAATTIDLEIQGVDATSNSNNVSGMPDGTAITNGTASVSSKGGTAEWVTWTFGTAPTPAAGPHWLVLKPSGGSFNILIPYNQDWIASSTFQASMALERLYTTAWSGAVSLGPAPVRIKSTGGEYLFTGRPWYYVTGPESYNTRTATGTACVGMKFTAPFDMEVSHIGFNLSLGAFHYSEIVLVDSSDNELGRGGVSYSQSSIYGVLAGVGKVTLTAGSTYRAYLCKPDQTANASSIYTITLASSSDMAFLNLASGEFCYTTAADPPSEGGSGTWTDTVTEIPLGYILGTTQDLGALSGGGGSCSEIAFSYSS